MPKKLEQDGLSGHVLVCFAAQNDFRKINQKHTSCSSSSHSGILSDMWNPAA